MTGPLAWLSGSLGVGGKSKTATSIIEPSTGLSFEGEFCSTAEQQYILLHGQYFYKSFPSLDELCFFGT